MRAGCEDRDRRRAADARGHAGRPVRHPHRRRVFVGRDPDPSPDQGGDGDLQGQDQARRHDPDAHLEQAHDARARWSPASPRPTISSRASTIPTKATTTTTTCSVRSSWRSPATTRISARSRRSKGWVEQEPDEDEWVWTDDYSNVIGAILEQAAGIAATRLPRDINPVAQRRPAWSHCARRFQPGSADH